MIFIRIINSIISRLKTSIRIFFLANNYYVFDKRKFDFLQYHFSQEGEDIVFWKIINAKRNGFYVDVGAHHPQRLSNTHFLYLKGWRGINIDPFPGSKLIFDKIRSEDVNLECGISSSPKQLNYFRFDEPLLNTFSNDLMLEYVKMDNVLIDSQLINTFPLSDILENHVPQGKIIDLLTIDVEGLDLEVLISNDWERFRPKYIIVEDLNSKNLIDLVNSDIFQFLISKEYEGVSKLHNSIIFKSLI